MKYNRRLIRSPLRRSPFRRSLRRSPLRRSPFRRSLRRSPLRRSLRRSPLRRSLRRSPLRRSLRSPLRRSLFKGGSMASIDQCSSPDKYDDINGNEVTIYGDVHRHCHAYEVTSTIHSKLLEDNDQNLLFLEINQRILDIYKESHNLEDISTSNNIREIFQLIKTFHGDIPIESTYAKIIPFDERPNLLHLIQFDYENMNEWRIRKFNVILDLIKRNYNSDTEPVSIDQYIVYNLKKWLLEPVNDYLHRRDRVYLPNIYTQYIIKDILELRTKNEKNIDEKKYITESDFINFYKDLKFMYAHICDLNCVDKIYHYTGKKIHILIGTYHSEYLKKVFTEAASAAMSAA